MVVVVESTDSHQDEPLIPDSAKQQLRAQLVPAMISLASPMDKNLRAQVAETVSVIAGYDFPERWDGLVQVRSGQMWLYAASQLDSRNS